MNFTHKCAFWVGAVIHLVEWNVPQVFPDGHQFSSLILREHISTEHNPKSQGHS
jgi:hypothetical protein